MSGFWKTSSTWLLNSVLWLCLSLGLLVTACSNPGVALNSQPVLGESVSMDSAEAAELDQARVEVGSVGEVINGSGL